MLFNSGRFLIFLLVVFALYWTGRSRQWQNCILLLASYIFYAFWDWRFLGLVMLSSFLCWGCGIQIGKYRESSPGKAKLFNIINIVSNLGILCYFKYYNFFAQSFANLFLGGDSDDLLLNMILPVGISFYTFKALCYTIEIWRGNITAERNPVILFVYVGFFPQLLAGPIARPNSLIPQLSAKREFAYEDGVQGLRQILWGLFKKVVVAGNCALYVNQIWSDYYSQSGSTLLVAAILYCFQIYGDFSGYSDMSVGIGKLFGIGSDLNFRTPYFSRNISEFWRRWHISLTSWFRDYVYIPMGGSRCSSGRVIFNTFIVFLLSGLWHGANWTFVMWGAYNAVLFVPELLMGNRRRKFKDTVAMGRAFPNLKELARMVATFVLVMFGWIIFRADNLEQTFRYFTTMLSFRTVGMPMMYKIREVMCPALIGAVIVILVEWKNRFNSNNVLYINNRLLRWLAYCALVYCLFRFSGGSSDFIYFQF